jgi:uncharacterized protein YacL
MMPKEEIFVIKIFLRFAKWFLKYWENLFLVISFMSIIILFGSILNAFGLFNSSDLYNSNSLEFLKSFFVILFRYALYGAFIAMFIIEFLKYLFRTFSDKEFVLPYSEIRKYGYNGIIILSLIAFLINTIAFREFPLSEFIGLFMLGIFSFLLWLEISRAINKIGFLIQKNDVYKTKEESEEEKINSKK